MDIELDNSILWHLVQINQHVQRYDVVSICCYRQVFEYFQVTKSDKVEKYYNYYHRLPIEPPSIALNKFIEFLRNINYDYVFRKEKIKTSILILIEKMNQFVKQVLDAGVVNYNITYQMV